MMQGITGKIFIVAAPSGGGKTSLVRQLVQEVAQIEISISHTTRNIRSGEKEGLDYFFITEAQFKKMIEDGDFIEHAQVFNHFYGTSKAQIEKRLASGIDVVLDIDWQGAAQIKKIFPDSISIFIIPPSLATLKKRLEKRGRDNPEIIKARMKKAQEELSHYPEFDYLIINDDFNQAAAELKTIVTAYRLQLGYQQLKNQKLLSLLLSSR